MSSCNQCIYKNTLNSVSFSSTSSDQAAMETNNSEGFLSHTKPFEYTKRHWELNPSTRGQPESFVWLLDIILQSVNI